MSFNENNTSYNITNESFKKSPVDSNIKLTVSHNLSLFYYPHTLTDKNICQHNANRLNYSSNPPTYNEVNTLHTINDRTLQNNNNLPIDIENQINSNMVQLKPEYKYITDDDEPYHSYDKPYAPPSMCNIYCLPITLGVLTILTIIAFVFLIISIVN